VIFIFFIKRYQEDKMNIIVGYNGLETARKALKAAQKYVKVSYVKIDGTLPQKKVTIVVAG